MEEKRTSGVVWVVAVMLLSIGLTSAYMAAYFLRGGYTDERGVAVRVFANSTEARFFRPAAKVESILRQRRIETTEPLGV